MLPHSDHEQLAEKSKQNHLWKLCNFPFKVASMYFLGVIQKLWVRLSMFNIPHSCGHRPLFYAGRTGHKTVVCHMNEAEIGSAWSEVRMKLLLITIWGHIGKDPYVNQQFNFLYSKCSKSGGQLNSLCSSQYAILWADIRAAVNLDRDSECVRQRCRMTTMSPIRFTAVWEATHKIACWDRQAVCGCPALREQDWTIMVKLFNPILERWQSFHVSICPPTLAARCSDGNIATD